MTTTKPLTDPSAIVEFTTGPAASWWFCKPCNGVTEYIGKPEDERCPVCGTKPERGKGGTTTVVGVDRDAGVVTASWDDRRIPKRYGKGGRKK